LLTRTGRMNASQMTVNAQVSPVGGELRVRILDGSSKPYPGFDWDDCTLVRGDRVNHPIAWKGANARLAGQPVRFEFRFRNATVWSIDLHP
jgi:hypothetical protein